MAINQKGGNNNTFGQAQGEPVAEQKANQGEQAAPGRGRRRSIFEVNRTHRRSIARSQLGELVSRWREAIEGVIKNPTMNDAPDAHQILVFNGETNNTPFSALIHVTKSIDGLKSAVYHTLLLEGSSEPLQPELKRVDHMEIEIIRTAGEAYDVTMEEKIATLVADTLPGYELEASGFTVISSENKPDDDNVKAVLFFSNAANEAHLDRIEGVEPFRIQDSIDPDNDNLRGRLEYDPEPMDNVNGLPVRSDIHVAVTAHSRSNQGQSMRLTEVDAFVDLVLDQDANMGAGNVYGGGGLPSQFGPQTQPNFQRYWPRAVLTRADNHFNMISLETELLALITVAQMAKDSAYTGVWRPRKGIKQKDDLRDIGAVNLELGMVPDAKDPNRRVRINTKSDSFSDNDAYHLIRTVVKPDLIYSMDIEEGGEHSWVQQGFLMASAGDNDAHEAIIQAADNLTGGFFRQFFDPNEPICVHDGNRIQLGYYIDKTGERRDLREIDHLAMLNMFGETNLEIVDRYADTFDRVNENMDVRLHVRTQILRDAVGDIHVKGYADRINLTPSFMNALVSAAAKAELSIDPAAMHQKFNTAPRGNGHIGRFANQGFTNDLFAARNPTSSFGRGSFGGGGTRW